MKLITLLTIILVVWVIYALIQSNNDIRNELKEMRMACMNNGINIAPSANTYDDNSYKNNLNSMKNTLISSLSSLITPSM
jgi:hypothetical protein